MLRRSRLATKVFVTTLLALILLIPLAMIRGIVGERRARRDGVIAEIAQSSVERQRVTGPILIVPWSRAWTETATDSNGIMRPVPRVETGVVRLSPENVTFDTTMHTEVRRRGIYAVTVYKTRTAVRGEFRTPPRMGLAGHDTAYGWGQAKLVLGIADPRGLKEQFEVNWDGNESPFEAGADGIGLANGVHANVAMNAETGGPHRFELTFPLDGMEGLDFVPAGRSSRVNLRSAWPHPSFVGKYLPETREVSAQGFRATWVNSNLSTNTQALVAACETGACALETNTFGVNLIDPVDVYLKAERSMKYAFLFVAITFVLFFLFEVLRRLAIHPLQYTLVGTALAMFFLLLIALSEHVAFAAAYAIAAGACVALIGFYVSHTLGSVRRALGLSGLLASLYGMLFVLLSSEDHALVFGAVLLFALLTALMYVTRRIDWYRVGDAVGGGTQPG